MFEREMNAGLLVRCDPFSVKAVALLVDAKMSTLEAAIENASNAATRIAIISTFLVGTIGLCIWFVILVCNRYFAIRNRSFSCSVVNGHYIDCFMPINTCFTFCY
jgi:hypothetical protein